MPRTTQNLTITEDTSWEKLWATEAGSALRLAKPWATLVLVFLAGLGLHLWLGRPAYIAWASAGLTLSGVVLTAFAWNTSRLVATGRVHSSATVAAAAAWLLLATIAGPVKVFPLFLLIVGGATVALTWNFRSRARLRTAENGGTPATRLADWFADAARGAGVPGTTLQVQAIEPHRATATAALPPGERTAADLQNRARYVESAGQVPPGALAIAEDPDRADHAIVTLSDPRLIRQPIPHPGPSAPGESIARPLRTGMWQDGVPVMHPITGHHLHVMGASGSGKSEGGLWNYAAEIITRYDAAMFGADITKANQTFGPLEPALHRVEYTKDGVRDFLNTLHKLVPQRSAWLGDHGLTKWVPGCGLTYWFPWLEEVPDIVGELTSKEEDNLVSDVRALRSAGGTWGVSLQKSIWDQLPPIIRGQMAKLCFGLQDSGDARYGLSEQQLERGADPAAIGLDHPGTAYLHYPGTPPERIAMRMRTYAWGDTSSKERHDLTAGPAMAAYAAQYPASARPVDEITAILIGGQPAAARQPAAGHPARPVAVLTSPRHAAPELGGGNQEDEEDLPVTRKYLETDDPDPTVTALIRDDATDEQLDALLDGDADDQEFEFTQGPKPTPAEARQIFTTFLEGLREEDPGRVLKTKDFRPIFQGGMLRQWVQARLRELVEQGVLIHDEEAQTYQFAAPARVS
jgi:hypothetical protein